MNDAFSFARGRVAQRLKDEVQAGIGAAALEVFAREGFAGATMAAIAERAGVSAGNIYRYYGGKDELFYALVTDEFVAAFGSLLRRRVASLAGVADARALDPGAPFHAATRELVAFCVAHRLAIVVLLGRAEGTRHAGFAEGLVASLASLAVAHFRALDPRLRVTKTMRFSLEHIYRNLVRATAAALEAFAEGADIARAFDDYGRYHLAGLKHFFEGR